MRKTGEAGALQAVAACAMRGRAQGKLAQQPLPRLAGVPACRLRKRRDAHVPGVTQA
jgi:hypothetical protein